MPHPPHNFSNVPSYADNGFAADDVTAAAAAALARFAFRRRFLDYLPADEPDHFFEQRPVQAVTRENKLGLFPHNGFWLGMDTFREYTALNEMWDRDEAPWKLW